MSASCALLGAVGAATLIPRAEAQDQGQGPKTAAEAPKEAAAPEGATIAGPGIQPSSATPVKALTEDELVKMAAASLIDSLSDLPQSSSNSTLNAALGGRTIPSGSEVGGANSADIPPILLAQAREQGPPVAAAAATPKEAAPAEITITGSRIQLSPGMYTPTPVTAVTQDELVKMAPTQLIDSLSALPQFYGNNNAANGGAAGGQAPGGEEVNLRGANTSSGISRTLVLLDGRRSVANSRFGAVDVGSFPDDLVKSVEIVTGGASASYGTDAVAGVVNFILDDRFEGIKLTAQGGETARHDGPTDKFSITAGHQFGDKLHIVGSLSEFNQDPISSFSSLQSRPWINQTAEVSGPRGGPTYQVAPYVIPTNFSYNGTVVLPGSPINGMQFSPDGRSLLPAPVGVLGAVGDSCLCLATKNETYGVNSADEVQGGYTRKNAFVHVTYDINDKWQVYGQGMFSDDYADSRWQSASLLDSWQAPVGLDNPYLTSDVRTTIGNALATAYPAGSPLNPTGMAGYHYVYPGYSTLATQYFTYGIYLPNNSTNPLGETRQATGNNTKQGTIGFKGELRGDWKIDGYFNEGETIEDYIDFNGTRVDRLFLAMDAVSGPNGPICRVASPTYDPQYYKSFSDCVPINLFGGVNQISPQAAAYVSGPTKVAKQYYDLTNGELTANGSLFKGIGAGPVKVAFGVDWRKEQVQQITPDASNEYPAFLNGQLIGATIPTNPLQFRGVIPEGFLINQYGYTQPWNNSPTVACAPATATKAANTPCSPVPAGVTPNLTGGIPGLWYVPGGYLGDANSSSVMFSSERTFGGSDTVKEAFTEFNIPLLKDKPFFEDVSFDIAGRWADYSGSGTVWAYKGGLNWAINDTVRLRATRSQDVRAASLEERFDVTRGGVVVQNPYVLTNGQPTTQSGAGFSGGNPNLKPEKATTTVAGFVLTPQFVQGLSVSVDWYEINIADAIDKPTTQNIVDFAFAGDPTYKALVKLDPNNNIVEVDQYFINFSEQFINGVDVEVAYRHSANLIAMMTGSSAPESFAVRLYGTDMMKNATLTGFGTYNERAGTFGIPKQKATLDLTYNWSNYSMFIQSRYESGGLLSSTLVQSPVALTGLPPGIFTINDNQISSVFLTDLNLSWQVPVSAGDLNTYFEVNNLFDKQPPQCPGVIGRAGVGTGACGGDPLGRRYTIGLRYRY